MSLVAEWCPSGRRSATGNRVSGVEPDRGFESHPLRQFSLSTMGPNQAEIARRNAVIGAILDHVRSDTTIALPAFDRNSGNAGDEFALQSVGSEPNDFGGTVGELRYQFEGEEDLLHLFVMRLDGGPLDVREAQTLTSFVLADVPPALIWLRPGEHSQHFYVAHDDLLEYLSDPRA